MHCVNVGLVQILGFGLDSDSDSIIFTFQFHFIINFICTYIINVSEIEYKDIYYICVQDSRYMILS